MPNAKKPLFLDRRAPGADRAGDEDARSASAEPETQGRAHEPGRTHRVGAWSAQAQQATPAERRQILGIQADSRAMDGHPPAPPTVEHVGGFQFTIDERGRTIGAEGWLTPNDAPRSAAATAAQRESAAGLPGHDGGHLVPHVYGGPDSGVNMVPLPATTNRSWVKSTENVAGRHMHDQPVYMRVSVEYDADNRVPSAIKHEYFTKSADGELVRLNGAENTLHVDKIPGHRDPKKAGRQMSMSDALRDPHSGKAITPKEWNDPENEKGRGPYGAH